MTFIEISVADPTGPYFLSGVTRLCDEVSIDPVAGNVNDESQLAVEEFGRSLVRQARRKSVAGLFMGSPAELDVLHEDFVGIGPTSGTGGGRTRRR